MARNIEIKARIVRVEDMLPAVRALSERGPEVITQDDTFFNTENGRLKLRDFGDGTGELIFYQREDTTGPKTSNYLLSRTTEPGSLREALRLAYGARGRVCKTRLLFLARHTRIHLDHVEGLGDFLELETVLREDQTAEQGLAETQSILTALRIETAELLPCAYIDLLLDHRNPLRYHLLSKRFGFGVWARDDADDAVLLWGDARVTKYIGGPFDEAQARARLEYEMALQDEHGISYWPLRELESGKFAGCCGLHPRSGKVMELGVHLLPDFQGKAIAEEVSRSVIRHAFGRLGAAALFAGHHPGNDASRHILAALGFHYTHDEFYGPTRLQHQCYLMTADTFQERTIEA